MADLFYLEDNHDFEPRWSWAWRCVPDLNELGQRCPRCGEGLVFDGDYYPSFGLRMELEGGKRQADYQGNASFLLAISARVWEDMQEAGITGVEAYPLELFRPKVDVDTGVYYHLKVLGRCDLDLKAMGVRLVEHCSVCMRTRYDKLTNYGYHLQKETWDGSDLFITRYGKNIHFCSQRLLDLAREKQWTNFRFEVPEHPRGPAHEIPKPIEYKRRRRPSRKPQ